MSRVSKATNLLPSPLLHVGALKWSVRHGRQSLDASEQETPPPQPQSSTDSFSPFAEGVAVGRHLSMPPPRSSSRSIAFPIGLCASYRPVCPCIPPVLSVAHLSPPSFWPPMLCCHFRVPLLILSCLRSSASRCCFLEPMACCESPFPLSPSRPQLAPRPLSVCCRCLLKAHGALRHRTHTPLRAHGPKTVWPAPQGGRSNLVQGSSTIARGRRRTLAVESEPVAAPPGSQPFRRSGPAAGGGSPSRASSSPSQTHRQRPGGRGTMTRAQGGESSRPVPSMGLLGAAVSEELRTGCQGHRASVVTPPLFSFRWPPRPLVPLGIELHPLL